jgi:hypothetical protein
VIRRTLGKALLLAMLGVATLVGGITWYSNGSGTEGWRTNSTPKANLQITDEAIRTRFLNHAQGLGSKAYEDAFRYLFEGYLNYRSPQGAFVFYPGAHSGNGNRVDGLEGFARFMPLASSWLASGKSDAIELSNRTVSVAATLREGLLAGTRRDGPEYWGTIVSQQQRLVESADVALGLWLSRDHIWSKLSVDEKKQVVTWLERAMQVDTFPGNWTLFPVLVQRVLVALGADNCCYDQTTANQYRQFKTLYKGDGWFEDPPNGFDYYNAWAVQYVLFWLDQIDPQFDPQFIRAAHKEFVGFYKHLVSPRGVPMMGRSVCYRMATSTPLLIAQILAPEQVSKGMAGRALDATWGYFVSNGALANGVITQGFCGKDLSVVNNYSGPASCLWGTRALVVALHLEPKLKLLDASREPLPVERGDFQVRAASIKWSAKGSQSTGEVVLTLESNPNDAIIPLQRYGIKQQLLEWLTHKPKRPDNHHALYDQRQYSSHRSEMACDKHTQ